MPQREDVLNENQERFCIEFIRTGNAAASYRSAYDKPDEARDEWIYVSACQMLDKPKIQLRIEELREAATRLGAFNVLKAMEEYEEARTVAASEAAAAAMVSATTAKVKLLGLDRMPGTVELKDGEEAEITGINIKIIR